MHAVSADIQPLVFGFTPDSTKRHFYSTRFMNSKPKRIPILNSSWEVWDCLREKAGLDLKGYDQELVPSLCIALGIPLPVKNLSRELKARNVSVEEFIAVLLRAIQPYAEMMSDICTFFYLHGVKKTNSEMKVLFDFGNGPEDLGFNLRNFREILWKYKQVTQKVIYYGLSIKTLWSIANIFRNHWQSAPKDRQVLDWISKYSAADSFDPPIANFPDVESKEVNVRIQKAFQVWSTIVLECRKYGGTRRQLKEASELIRNREQEKEEDEIKAELELPSFQDWSPNFLFHVDQDRWPATFLTGLTCYIESLSQVPRDYQSTHAKPIIDMLDKVFSDLPKTEKEQNQLIQGVIEILNLPIWKKRYELYQTWILSVIDNAIKNYDRTIHHVNGSLVLKFSGSHVATLETKNGRVHLWSELRSPLANPLSKTRKSNIQPDYSISFEPITEPSQSIIVIECKQYSKPSVKNFTDALNDYSRGRPNANVFLVNYGGVPSNLFAHVCSEFRSRAHAFGNMAPGNKSAIDEFKNSINSILPKPIHSGGSHHTPPYGGFDLIAVDISGSMNDLLSDQAIINTMLLLTTLSQKAQLMAVDTSVKGKWEQANKHLDDLLALPRNGSTNLKHALSDLDLSNTLVITDSDGVSQLQHSDKQPLIILKIATGSNVSYIFKGDLSS